MKSPPLTKQRHQCELVPLSIKSFINKNTALKECRAGASPVITMYVVNRGFDLKIKRKINNSQVVRLWRVK